MTASPRLKYSDGVWRIHMPDNKAVVAIDFLDKSLLARTRPTNLGGEYVVRAVRGRKVREQPLRVLDATAGFGHDAFLLAAAGCEVTLVEQQNLLHFLLDKALLALQGQHADIAARMSLLQGNSLDIMRDWHTPAPDIIYLDPMYSADSDSTEKRGLKKTAAVKKNMVFLQWLSDQSPQIDVSGEGLLPAALRLAKEKVIVKRAPNAGWLAGIKPASTLAGKAARFDVYPTK